MQREEKNLYDLGGFRVDPVARELRFEGRTVALTPRAFDTLLALVRNAGRVITREQLLRDVWPGTFVSDGTLSQNVHTLRRAFARAGDGRCYIETLPRRGYRLAVPVQTVPLPPELAAAAAGPIQVLAVLPPVTLGPEEDRDLLGLGIADALITGLGRLPHLTVRPTSAVYPYAAGAHDPLAAGRALRADAVLQGTVQRLGPRLRVSVQLIGVRDGDALWADRFDEVFTDAFAAQDAIAERVIEALRPELSAEERSLLRARPTTSAEAHEACVRGRYFWNQRSPEGLDAAIRHFNEALRHDGECAPAFAGLADCYSLQPMYAGVPADEAFPRARAAAQHALALDGALAEAHVSLAYTLLFYNRDWAQSEAGFRQALALRPGYATAHHWYAFLLTALGRLDEAVARASHARELDPLSRVIGTDLGMVLYFARRNADAAGQFEKTLELDPGFAYAYFGLSLVHEAAGRTDAAVEAARRAVEHSRGGAVMRAALGRALALAGRREEARGILETLRGASDQRVEAGSLALVLDALGETDAALAQLSLARRERSRFVLFLNVWPVFDRLREDPRFRDLAHEIGLPPPAPG